MNKVNHESSSDILAGILAGQTSRQNASLIVSEFMFCQDSDDQVDVKP